MSASASSMSQCHVGANGESGDIDIIEPDCTSGAVAFWSGRIFAAAGSVTGDRHLHGGHLHTTWYQKAWQCTQACIMTVEHTQHTTGNLYRH